MNSRHENSLYREEISSRLNLVHSDLRITPRDPRVHAERCLLFSALRDEERSERAYRLGVRLCPDAALLPLVGAAIASNRGEDRLALERAKRALELDSENPEAWQLLSAIHLNLEEVAASHTARATALRLSEFHQPGKSSSERKLWSQHPILRRALPAKHWMDRRSLLTKLAIKICASIPLIAGLTALEVGVANFPIKEAFLLTLVPAVVIGELSHRTAEAMLIAMPRLRSQMSLWSKASGGWTLGLLSLFLGLVVVQALGHGGGPLMWMPFFTVCAFGAIRHWTLAADQRVIHVIGAMSALVALYGAVITPM